eukprot:CAMPEP_0204312528 /NCGR_PEP_ID=MMETSP0469-20131031/3029_1 /ASSEMBLY_ACC=CAM_ASM_000384 /TAXON_ID=2969 /ORGANISM="Oxyrrhis marina" /LENGTH=137 /DNA_ID=CAMNT_0051292671 /DNA_START=127 /DNA_END=538 /DNA_ORIENTATION=-
MVVPSYRLHSPACWLATLALSAAHTMAAAPVALLFFRGQQTGGVLVSTQFGPNWACGVSSAVSTTSTESAARALRAAATVPADNGLLLVLSLTFSRGCALNATSMCRLLVMPRAARPLAGEGLPELGVGGPAERGGE